MEMEMEARMEKTLEEYVLIEYIFCLTQVWSGLI